MWFGLVLVGLVLVGGFIGLFNGLVRMRQLTQNAWADVDVYLKRRSELIPNLVAAVKGYATHESTLLEALALSRTQALAAGSLPARADAEGEVAAQLHRTLILAENYPDLKSSANFLNLQQELSTTETKIASARQYYNACVRDLNTKIEAFPSSIVAASMGLKNAEFFQVVEPTEREVVSVAGI